MNWVSILRAGYGAALLAVPDVVGGRPRTERLTTAVRCSMRVLAARQMFEAAVCGVAPSRCLLRLEAMVDVVHAATMLIVATATDHVSTRRAAAVNVVTAAAFVGADILAAASLPPPYSGPPRKTALLQVRDRTAQWFCRTLPYPAGTR